MLKHWDGSHIDFQDGHHLRMLIIIIIIIYSTYIAQTQLSRFPSKFI